MPRFRDSADIFRDASFWIDHSIPLLSGQLLLLDTQVGLCALWFSNLFVLHVVHVVFALEGFFSWGSKNLQNSCMLIKRSVQLGQIMLYGYKRIKVPYIPRRLSLVVTTPFPPQGKLRFACSQHE